MTDHADRSWCTKPNSPAWWGAALRQWRFDHPKAVPLVGISSARPRIPAMFDRVMK